MQTLESIYNAAIKYLLGTRCMSKADLAEGTSAAKYKTTAAIAYSIDGIAYKKAATDDIAFSAGHAVQADLTTRRYLVQINAAGTFSTKQGAAGGNCPTPDAGNCAVGAIKVVTSGGTFTPDTTDLGAAAVTDTYFDFAVMPANLAF